EITAQILPAISVWLIHFIEIAPLLGFVVEVHIFSECRCPSFAVFLFRYSGKFAQVIHAMHGEFWL
ncbi:hypothetical protein ACRN9N_21195, partial [Shewanella baltica]|uniref:hypothetical protein n=1 Tax=Shewanella baltica TaxID=62322 RepID=UPI003D78F641